MNKKIFLALTSACSFVMQSNGMDDQTDSGMHTLHAYAAGGDIDKVSKFLASHGHGMVNLRDDLDRTALHCAANVNRAKIVRVASGS